VRVVTARGKKYIYLAVKTKIDGKIVERKIMRLPQDIAGTFKVLLEVGDEMGGIARLRLAPIGYIIQDLGHGLYTVERTLKKGKRRMQGLVFATEKYVTCFMCKSGCCDHVKAFKQALK